MRGVPKLILLLIVIAGLFLVAAPRSAGAEPISYADAELISALDSAYWIALSDPKPKKVYVLAAPWCPYCRLLHKTITEHPSDIEYRFILTAPHSAADRFKIGRASFARSAALMDELYRGIGELSGGASKGEVFADGVNDALWSAIAPALQTRSAQPLGMPTLVFMSGGRLRVLAGMPKDLSPLSAVVDAGGGALEPADQTKGEKLTPPELKPISAKVAYAKRNDTYVFIAPSLKATKLGQLKTGAGLMAKAMTEKDGERWYAFQFAKEGPPAAFGREKDFR